MCNGMSCKSKSPTQSQSKTFHCTQHRSMITPCSSQSLPQLYSKGFVARRTGQLHHFTSIQRVSLHFVSAAHSSHSLFSPIQRVSLHYAPVRATLIPISAQGAFEFLRILPPLTELSSPLSLPHLNTPSSVFLRLSFHVASVNHGLVFSLRGYFRFRCT